jgi:MFS family permease
MIDVTAVDEISGDVRARSNVVRLAAAQALTGANSAVIFATGSIVGATLAPSISLATVPLSMYVVGLAAGTLPTGAISRAYGRRVAFIVGTGCGVLTGLLGAFAILRGSFVLFCGAAFSPACSARSSCSGPWISGRPICSRSVLWCRRWSR